MNMALLQEWRDYAYKFDDRTAEGQQFWLNYFNIEKGIYEQLLADKDTVVSGTVKELADKYETELQMFVGFLDGINRRDGRKYTGKLRYRLREIILQHGWMPCRMALQLKGMG